MSEIKADDLIRTCYFSNFIGWEKDFEGVFIEKTAPADIVEWAIQQYFDVDSEYLRTSTFYNPEDHTYKLVGGFGGSFATCTIRGEQRGNKLSVEIGLLSTFTERELLPGETLIKTEGYPDQILTPKGVLTLELINGKIARYVSYKRYD
ncbi:hypothetical protein SDC9_204185 [bioreactor metagenome]|uniref:Uncharacterized protein n=1 Tax=bioreactor metagenome TaxID=1076179 RepID=A0A645IYH3_9ZZZZ